MGTGCVQALLRAEVTQCVDAKLVDGNKIFMDGSLIDADASNNSVVDTHSLKRYLNQGYLELEKRLADVEKQGDVNTRHVSTTDPDASVVRHGKGKPKLRYKTHRAVDGLHEVITAVKATPSAVDEGHEMTSLIEAHEVNIGIAPTTVVADSQYYGTKENLLICHDRNIKAHMPVTKTLLGNTSSREGIFPEERFTYDKEKDVYICPAGKILKKRTLHENKQNIEYAASKKECAVYSLRPQCTKSKGPRTVQRHVRQEVIDHMSAKAQSIHAKADLRTRKHLMERSFARSTRFRFDRARWRGLWKIAIQEYLVCTIQNIETLLRYGPKPVRAALNGRTDRNLKKTNGYPSSLQRLLYHFGLRVFMSTEVPKCRLS